MTARTRWALVALGLLALMAFAAPAQAQMTPTLELTADAPEGALNPGERVTVQVTVANRGDGEGEARLSPPTPPEGWTARLDGPSTFTLGAGESRRVPLTVEAPEDSGAPTTATFRVDGVIESPLTGSTDSASTAFDVAVEFPPPPAPEPFPWLQVGAAAAAVLAAGAGAFTAWVRRRRGAVTLDAPHAAVRVLPGFHAHFKTAVENRSQDPLDVRLVVDGVPPDWTAAFSTPNVTVKPGERREVSFAAKAPPHTREGDVGVIMIAAEVPGRFRGRPTTLVRAEVQEPRSEPVIAVDPRDAPAPAVGDPGATSTAPGA